jgi:hypothetical protein
MRVTPGARTGLARIALAAGAAMTLALALPAAASLDADGDHVRVTHNADRNAQTNPRANARNPAVAAGNGKYLAVWTESTNNGNPKEVWGRALDAAGAYVGSEIRLSNSVRPSGCNCSEGIGFPAVAYDSRRNEFLVVWEAEEGNFRRYEISGQVVKITDEGATPVGEDFQISNANPPGQTTEQAQKPAVAYAPDGANDGGEYVVVWEDTRLATGTSGGTEIFGQRVRAGGGEEGVDFRISEATSMGADKTTTGAGITYNALTERYLVAWFDDRHGIATKEPTEKLSEPFAQRIGADGALQGDDVRLDPEPDAGPDGQPGPPPGTTTVGFQPLDIASDPETGRDFVVFESGKYETADEKGLQPQIVGWLVSANGARNFQTVNDIFRQPGCRYDGCRHAFAIWPSIARSTKGDEWLVTWLTNGLETEMETIRNTARWKSEVFGQRLDDKIRPEPPCPEINITPPCESHMSTEVGDDFQISKMSDRARLGAGAPIDEERTRHAAFPDVTYDAGSDRFMTVWEGDGLAYEYHAGPYTHYGSDDWFEIWAQRLVGPAPGSGGPGDPVDGDPGPGGGDPDPPGGDPDPPGGNPNPPGGTPKPPAVEPGDPGEDFLQLLRELLATAGGAVGVPVGCEKDSPDPVCRGTASGETVEKLPAQPAVAAAGLDARGAAKAKKRRLKLRAVKFGVPRGTTKVVKLKLTRDVAKVLKKRGKLKLRITIDRGKAGKTVRVVTVHATQTEARATKKGAFKVRVAFPAATDAAKPAAVTALRGRKVAASKAVKAAPGKTKVVKLKLGAAPLAALKKNGKLALRIVTRSVSRAAIAQTASQKLAVKLPRRR